MPSRATQPRRWRDEPTTARIATWVAVPLVALVVLTFGGALVGTAIGDAAGFAEAEGFIGFIYGSCAGAGLGLVVGILAAWRIDRRLRRTESDADE